MNFEIINNVGLISLESHFFSIENIQKQTTPKVNVRKPSGYYVLILFTTRNQSIRILVVSSDFYRLIFMSFSY